MLALRIFLVSILALVLAYTGIVGAAEGWNFMPVFVRDIVAMKWPGQFNLDFACLLALGGLWVAWRHQFAPAGIVLALLTVVGGTPVLSTYLLVASVRADGDAQALLLGKARALA